MANEINTVGAIQDKFGGYWVEWPRSQCLTKAEILASNVFIVNGSYGDTECPRMDDIAKGIFPIASYRTYGKTNSSSDRNILKDLTGHGYDMTLYNFSYSGTSGYVNGGLQFDGVDDFAVCYTFPALNNGFTVVMIRQLLYVNAPGSTLTKRHVTSSGDLGAFQMEHYNNASYPRIVRSYSKDNIVSFDVGDDICVDMIPTRYNYQDIETASGTDSNFLAINAGYRESSGVVRQFGRQQIFYALEIYDKILSITEVIDIRNRLTEEFYSKT